MTFKNSEDDIKYILDNYRSIAVVGISQNGFRASHGVSFFMQQNGYKILPVNPNYKEVLGVPCNPSLNAITEPVDIVNIFRRSEHVLPVVKEAVAIGAKVIWMQLGVINEEAALYAQQAGLKVVMDRCIKIDFSRYNR